ncbi:hypothetical protein BVX94_00930 [bacterium B17]|nr:hypothetical protein BVX94_00930 [bacterium B17]
MRAKVLPLFCVVCLLNAGCALLPQKAEPDFALTAQEDAISSAIAHYTMGKIYQQELGDHSYKTLEHLTKAGKFDESTYRKTLGNAEKLFKKNPYSYAHIIELGRAQHLSGKVEEAVISFQKAMAIEPHNPIAYVDLASLLFFNKRDDEAIAVLKSGMESSTRPRIVMDFTYRKGREFLATNEVPRAAECFMLVANMSKSRGAQLHHMLGELYEKLGFAQEAADSYLQAIENNSRLPNSYLRLAAIQLKSDQEKAMETLVNASKRLPEEPAIQMALGYLYNSRHDIPKAAESFEKTLILAENKATKMNLSPSFYLETASVYELLNKHDKANVIYEMCLKKFPKNHEILNYIAYTWAERAVNLDRAYELSIKSLKLNPDNGAYLDTLGWIYYHQKKYDEALKQIRRANEIVKDDPTIVEHMGDILNAMGKDDEAMIFWKRSYIIDSSNPAMREKLESNGVDVEKIKKETSK